MIRIFIKPRTKLTMAIGMTEQLRSSIRIQLVVVDFPNENFHQESEIRFPKLIPLPLPQFL